MLVIVKKLMMNPSLHLAILPLFESSNAKRMNIIQKILSQYKPHCNSDDIPESKPDYVVRDSEESDKDSEESDKDE